LVKDIEKQTNLNLFNRLKIQLINNNEVTIFNKTEIISKIENGETNTSTKTFNNQITTKTDFDNNWIIPLEQAWFFPKIKTQLV
jgi:hypothetical protein